MKYGYATYPAHPGFYVRGVKKRKHTYSARSSYGVRTVWKEVSSTPLGKFATRSEAQAVGKAWAARQKQPKLGSNFVVVVGNIGTVYDGPLFREALVSYSEYKQQSKENYGRAAGESVVLLKDGEPHYEYRGTLDDEKA